MRDRELLARLRQRSWDVRDQFTFDAHADALVAFFRSVIALRPPTEQTAA